MRFRIRSRSRNEWIFPADSPLLAVLAPIHSAWYFSLLSSLPHSLPSLCIQGIPLSLRSLLLLCSNTPPPPLYLPHSLLLSSPRYAPSTSPFLPLSPPQISPLPSSCFFHSPGPPVSGSHRALNLAPPP
ncbi:hypothetical protein XENTR_v10020254 [Xenopus tropicalis]|nr:hypothetical protein XENTR_v10020254 [Xenopus tropicalis]